MSLTARLLHAAATRGPLTAAQLQEMWGARLMRAAGDDWKPGLLQANVEKASVGATHGATSPGDTRTTETQVCSEFFGGSDGTIGIDSVWSRFKLKVGDDGKF